ncbi:putative signaling-like protein [Pseudomonas sp. CFII64]|uniref:bifunctional diguanylate cyclase/phosphodiesterase n=1 Tax=Pseudomonas sp. CFII64 TaxID=911242 RepID=UPI0003570E71|nr:EAL domain-containing protein [Pseudomonas sp. CFII64]EPJ87512.1 putative signaling-like protein [Pseudomonas sp. CFII64]
MPKSAPQPVAHPLQNRSSVALARASLFKFAGLLAAVILLASGLLVYVAHNLDTIEEAESAFYTRKAVQSLEKSLLLTVKDYAFWGDAYKHLHTRVDTDWAFVRQNVGPTLYEDFGFQGLFVVDAANRTAYSVINGVMQTMDIAQWLAQPIDAILDRARAGAENETPLTTFINVGGVPALVAAAAITPGTDPTVVSDDGLPSVLIFVEMLDSSRLAAIGNDYGVDGLHISTSDETHETSILPLGEKGSAGALHWQPPKPGQQLLGLVLPVIGIAALLVWLMTWAILRRTTVAARALDASFASLQASQQALATSEARFRDVVEASSDWIWEIDADWRFTYLSERFEIVTGLSRQDWIGAAIDDLLHTELGALSQCLSIPNRRPCISLQCNYLDIRGHARITRLSARELPGNGFRGTATDVTEEVEARRRIEFLSQHDALTGLPNRIRLQEFLDGKLKAMPTQEQPLVMLSLDLDRFKPVNDLLGHAAGDRVLNEVSRRLAECLRGGDLVARIGGDEFVLILTDISSQEGVEALCRRLIDSIEQPIDIDEQDIFISASIGIAMAPNDASLAAELLRYADMALYEAKAGGRNTWRFFADDMNARIIERRRLENDLRYAIRNGELRLHFQPRYRIADGRMVGAEALVRWQHPQRGLIPPDTFIPIAEETGLILPLSNWVLTTACQSAADWPEELFVSVNLSPTEFQRGNLVERIQQTLADTGIDPSRVELEVTESVMLDDAPGALEVMHALKRLGVRLSMDDFGTGYSSLSYLRSFPFDGLKIDRSFLNRLGASADDQSIIRAIVGLGRALSLTVTAEGIETAEHLELLKAVCCDEGQGYFLNRPMDAQSFDALLGTMEIAGT